MLFDAVLSTMRFCYIEDTERVDALSANAADEDIEDRDLVLVAGEDRLDDKLYIRLKNLPSFLLFDIMLMLFVHIVSFLDS